MQQADEPGARGAAHFDLVTEDGDLLCCAQDLCGFFIARAQEAPSWDSFVLAGCSPDDLLAKYCSKSGAAVGNVDVRILDDSGRAIGIYDVASVTVTQCRPHVGDEELLDIAVNGLFYSYPNPLAQTFWRQWREGIPTARGEWAMLTTEEREAWLEVARKFSACTRVGSDKETGISYEFDGSYVTDRLGLYCALGEAINGPGGYFGSNLDGLADCLRGGFGASAPFHLVWKESTLARAYLGHSSTVQSYRVSYFDALLDVFAGAGVTVELR